MTSSFWRLCIPVALATVMLGIDLAARRAYNSAAGSMSILAAFGLILLAAAAALFFWHRSEERMRQSHDAELALERCVEERTRELRQQVEDRIRAEQLNRGQKAVLEMLADPGDRSTEDILRSLAEVVASRNQGWETSIFLVERRGTVLTLTAASEVSDRLQAYLRQVGTDYPDTPERQAAITGETHIVERLTQLDLVWSRQLVDCGIFSVWSIPFCSANSSRLTGVLNIYSRSRTGPTPLELETVQSAARLAGLVIEHRAIRAELMRTAYEDDVTGLPNRRAGEQALEDAVRQSQISRGAFALFWVSIDNFRRINDHHGHAIGDHVLRTVANRIRHNPQMTGSVSRMGTSQFAAIVPGVIDELPSFEIARRLSAALRQPILSGAVRIEPQCVVGVCVCPTDGAGTQILLRNADLAVVRARNSDQPFCLFSQAMNDEETETIQIEEALGTALEQNQLRLVYQPIYSAKGDLTSFEALLRFQHPQLGNVPPSRFIPIAEQTRLIVPIGSWVVRQACGQMRAWIDAGLPPVRLSVNICALQFAREDFADAVAAVLEEFRLDPRLLTIELTESVVMNDFAVVLRQMNLLRQCGIHIAMDDFGTGYSSLSYLHRIPVDVLKIDRSFIEKLTEPEGTRPIVEAVMSLAHRLGLSVVAEGVETREQHAILDNVACHEYQGFLFARPMSAADAAVCLAASRTTRFANPFLQRAETAIA